MKHLNLLICALVLCTLAACGTATPTEQPTAPAAPPKPTLTPRPTPTIQPSATPAPTSEPTAMPIATYTAELSATVVAGLPPTAAPDSSGNTEPGIDGASVLPIEENGATGQLWAVWSHGLRAFDPQQNHFVAIYRRDDTGWHTVDKIELENADYLDEAGVEQVRLDGMNIWLAAESGVGAHGGCYDLLRFDGQKLHGEVSACGASPGVGQLTDVNGDGTPDVVIDASDAYVFCYACGVREVNYQVQRWDGQRMERVGLKPLPETAPAELRKLNDQAVAQAQAGLWKDALATAQQAEALKADNSDATWNIGLIRLTGQARAEQATSGAYPLLDEVFYGDYNAALDALRKYSPAELFGAKPPVVSGTNAEGWEQQVTDEITRTTDLALKLQPDLAPALFLRGWAVHLTDPANPAALADIERAAQLAPDDKLFADSAAYLRKQK
jgi:hypothetical protein